MEGFWMCVKAFIVGGAICVLAQLLIDKTRVTPAKILVGCVGLGVLLSALGLAEPIAKFAGAGLTTPIIGFGIALAKGTKSMLANEGFFGVLGGGLTATSVGIGAVIVLAFLAALFARPKDKG